MDSIAKSQHAPCLFAIVALSFMFSDVAVSDEVVELGLVPTGVSWTDDHHTAIYWGYKEDQETSFDSDLVHSHLCFVDLLKGERTGIYDLGRSIGFAWVTGEYLFAVSREGTLLYRYDYPSMENRRRLFLSESVLGIFRSDDGQVLVFSDDENNVATSLLQTDEFELVSVDASIANYDTRIYGPSGIFRTIEEYEPFFRDPSDGARTCLIEPFVFPTLTIFNEESGFYQLPRFNRGLNRGIPNPFGRREEPSRWGRLLQNYGMALTDARGNSIAELSRGYGRLLDTHPLVVTLSSSTAGDFMDTLTFFDIVEGQGLAERQIRGFDDYAMHGVLDRRIESVEDRVYFAFDSKIYIYDIPRRALSAESPFHLLHPELPPISLSDENVTIPFSYGGDTTEVSFELGTALEGLSIDQETGELTIAIDEIWTQFELAREKYRSGLTNWKFDGLRDSGVFQMVTGYELPSGFAAHCLPIHIAATSSDGQSDQIIVQQLILSPIPDVESTDIAAMELEENLEGGPRETWPVIDASEPFELTFSFEAEGSGKFQFRVADLSYHHKFRQFPANVQLNGFVWEDLQHPMPLWEELRDTFDIKNARVIEKNGRGTFGLEHTPNGFWVLYADEERGVGEYSITLELPVMERRRR